MTIPDATTERLSFDSEALPPGERVDRYRTLYAIGADVAQTGPAPYVRFEGWRLDRAILYHRRLNDLSHTRDRRRIEQDAFSHWTVTLVLDGWLGVDWGNGLTTIRPGEVLFVDVNRPGRNEARHARIATLSIAHERLEEVIGSVDGLHGLVLSAQDCRLYADLVGSLLSNLPALKIRSLPAVTEAMCALLKASLEAHDRGDGGAANRREAARMVRIRALVEGRLNDPTFDTEAATAESGLSRATLYRLMAPHHGLAAFIQTLRLEQVRRDLTNPADDRSFADIAAAAGFAAHTQASRAFLSHYGIQPSDYRASVTASLADADPIAQLRIWQHELR